MRNAFRKMIRQILQIRRQDKPAVPGDKKLGIVMWTRTSQVSRDTGSELLAF